MSADGTMLATVSREGYVSLWRGPRVEVPLR
jgi:hypothetical protein